MRDHNIEIPTQQSTGDHVAVATWPNLQIAECTRSISHNAPFTTEMGNFLFWMEQCGIWNRCSLGFVKLVYCITRACLAKAKGFRYEPTTVSYLTSFKKRIHILIPILGVYWFQRYEQQNKLSDCSKTWLNKQGFYIINPYFADFFLFKNNIKLYLHSLSFQESDTTQVDYSHPRITITW